MKILSFILMIYLYSVSGVSGYTLDMVKILDIYPQYVYVEHIVGYSRQCYNDPLPGIVIGGLIGNIITKDSRGTVGGAILGGVIGSNTCKETPITNTTPIINDYFVIYQNRGINYSIVIRYAPIHVGQILSLRELKKLQ